MKSSSSQVAFATTENDEVLTENDLDRFCRFFGEVGDCYQDYGERCATDELLEAIDPLLGLVDNFETQLCASNSSLRRTMIEQSKCIFKLVRNNKACIRDMMNSLEYILTGGFNHTAKMDLGCCLYERTCNCSSLVAIDKCGAEAASSLKTWGNEMHARFGFKIFADRCRGRIEENENICSALPSPGTSWEKTKKGKGKSILAKMVKQYNQFVQM